MTWPALMKRATAARYLDMSEAALEREVAMGRLPMAVTFGGRLHWRKDALDKAIAALGDEAMPAHENDFWNRGANQRKAG